MTTPVREGETIEGSRTMRNRPYPVLKSQVLKVGHGGRRLYPSLSCRVSSGFSLSPCTTGALAGARIRPGGEDAVSLSLYHRYTRKKEENSNSHTRGGVWC